MYPMCTFNMANQKHARLYNWYVNILDRTGVLALPSPTCLLWKGLLLWTGFVAVLTRPLTHFCYGHVF